MTDQENRPSTEPPHEETVLGRLADGPYDTQLGGGAGRPQADPIPAPPEVEGLKLPRGALLALRKSGGFRFSSRVIAVYRDGRVSVRNETPPRARPRIVQTLNADELADLRRLLDASDLPNLVPTPGRHNPDAFAYELVARIGRKVYAAEVFDGSIPAALAPLITQIQSYTSAD